jgi:hypothetical protein
MDALCQGELGPARLPSSPGEHGSSTPYRGGRHLSIASRRRRVVAVNGLISDIGASGTEPLAIDAFVLLGLALGGRNPQEGGVGFRNPQRGPG